MIKDDLLSLPNLWHEIATMILKGITELVSSIDTVCVCLSQRLLWIGLICLWRSVCMYTIWLHKQIKVDNMLSRRAQPRIVMTPNLFLSPYKF